MSERVHAPFDLSEALVGLQRDGATRLLEIAPGPPERIEGHTIGAPVLTGPPPHGGEMHPDGDELLFLVSGRLSVIVEEDGVERSIELGPGQCLIVPRGVWHRVVPRERSQLFHLTPGPGGEHRPRR